MGKAYDLFLEKIQTGYKVQMLGRDRARAQCPAHGGEDLNLSIANGDQGVLLKCHSYDCPSEDIARGVGLALTDLFDEGGKATYDYGNGHRVTRKRTRDGKQVFQQNKPAVTQLYRHPDSEPLESPSGHIVLVEGEKCVDAALRLGELCVTTWPGGASNVDQVDLSPLTGKHIVIIADNDEPGHRAASKLIRKLEDLATIDSVWHVPGEFGDKRSVDDLWVEGGALTDLVPLTFDQLPEPEPEPEPDRALALTKLSSVQTRMPRFLWDGMIPLGALTMLGGRGGTGKSSFMLWLAGLITRGLLRGELFGKPTPVLYVSHEDSLAEVVGPRCHANGVDTDLFYQLGVRSKEVEGMTVPRLPEDMPLIRRAIEQTGAKVIIIDPITSTMGGDNDKLRDVRMALDPLNQMGAELGVSVLAIAHFKKGGTGAAGDLISGSHAYRDASRCLLLFARDDESQTTVATIEKSNYGVSGQSFEFRLDIVDQMTDEGAYARVGKVVWEGQTQRDVSEVISREGIADRGPNLADEVLAYIESLGGGAIRTEQVIKEFGDSKPAAVRAALSRLGKRSKITSPAYGVWQAVTPDQKQSADVNAPV
ncbi:DNA primase [Microbacterium phage OneinaGillian]|uniref:DNA primase n=1 Tax=Microbacterium phage OneinaGillian TaxID=2301604 RepID=A0A385UED0_9CAUD|nr:DNA primase [Microbacterium phage OneinaGillian]AYB70182.1 DNA primase [Microbacterium phage OneinaGillian]